MTPAPHRGRRILVLNGAGGDGVAALFEWHDESLQALGEVACPGRGGAERLAGLVRTMLESADCPPASLSLIAAVTGPGSFTGLRAALSLAQGIAMGSGTPLQGVTVAEALRRRVGDTGGMPLWCVACARRDHVFIQRDSHETPQTFMLDALPASGGPVLLAGDASAQLAARLPDATDSGIACCEPAAIAAVAIDRLEGRLPPLPALPLYVDPPQAARPAAGLRPPPL